MDQTILYFLIHKSSLTHDWTIIIDGIFNMVSVCIILLIQSWGTLNIMSNYHKTQLNRNGNTNKSGHNHSGLENSSTSDGIIIGNRYNEASPLNQEGKPNMDGTPLER